ncbi:polyprenyl synthetase family protein [Telluribacter sp. SYSU D00476]|uniref:polyprenyl synthetase family protein n=1 Tax=Telluribacter sp. SYSU D00476 TaxID=2811430 RepID=UPI001FF3553C|nr:polyprenyl synthetase family protein [Telluribacter sp. SYSU D00476]
MSVPVNPDPSAEVQATPVIDSYPSDWPDSGPIDLQVHDLPHDSSTIEWWYQNAHVASTTGRTFSLFASFFRMAIGRDEVTRQFTYAHSITWALVDVDNQTYLMDSVVDQCAPVEGLKMIERGKDTADKLLQRALKEVFEKGNVPHPDRMLLAPALVNKTTLDLVYDANRFRKRDDGTYQLILDHPEQGIAAELIFTPLISPVRHGDNGVVKGTGGEDMFYYFIPQCEVHGTITTPDQQVHEVEGSGWYDHEFGKPTNENPDVDIHHDIAWNWVSLQLSNGYQVSGYDLFDNTKGGEGCGRWAIVIDPEGNSRNITDFSFTPTEIWTSSRTFTRYPTRWQLQIPELGVDLRIRAEFPEQEFITIISKPAFWEGRIRAEGTFDEGAVTGLGFIERSGFANIEKLEDFFKAVTRETRKSVEAMLPLEPTDEQFLRLVASEPNRHFLNGLDKERYVERVIRPIREIIDRGGKCWRSYAVLACIDVVGGNSQNFMDWLVWPELLHTGSLIIDDVQDRSAIRRGGPSCHEVHGEALAINAGNACYFIGQVLMLDDRLTPELKLKVYELYFETMRAAHAGQSIDISGFYDLMPGVVESGESQELEKRILGVHRLKSAVPASMLAELGAMQGGGSKEQVAGLGDFFEALGLAFQIIDDVLNLRGFKNDLKDKGEDITAGKITLPVARAMAYLPHPDREWLWQTVNSKPKDRETIGAVIEKLEACGAIDACQQQAEGLVEEAWKRLDRLVPDSAVKIRLRAFSWYVLNRHY